MTFDESPNGKLTASMLDIIKRKFDCCYDDKEEQHVRNLYKIITNIRGNLKVIHEGRKNVAANMTQLNDTLAKLWTMSKTNLMLVNECRQLFRDNYIWASINNTIERAEVRMVDRIALDALVSEYTKMLEYCQYTDEQMLQLVNRFPHLSKLYKGSDTLIHSIGAILR